MAHHGTAGFRSSLVHSVHAIWRFPRFFLLSVLNLAASKLDSICQFSPSLQAERVGSWTPRGSVLSDFDGHLEVLVGHRWTSEEQTRLSESSGPKTVGICCIYE